MAIEESPENLAQMQDFLLELVKQYRKGISKIDGTATREAERNFIEFILKKVKDEILPDYPAGELGIYKEGRALRSFECELKRLWEGVIAIYRDYMIERLPELAKQIMEDDPEESKIRYKHAVSWQVNNITVPLLEEHSAPGDDLLLYLMHTLLYSDDVKAIDLMAENLETPPQLFTSFLGMFGLLIQARKSVDSGSLAEAYTYLIDASFMLGAYESSSYITTRFDRIAKSRQGKKMAKVKHEKDKRINEGKELIRELFFALMPLAANGQPRSWKSANEAMTVISEVLEAKYEHLRIGDSTTLTLCRSLQNREKAMRKRNKYGFYMNISHRKKDGAEVRIPISLDD